MLKNNRAAILGGDLKQITAARKLAQHSFETIGIGLPSELSEGIFSAHLEEIQNCSAVILPLPASMDLVNVSNTEPAVSLDAVLSHMPEDAVLLGGYLPDFFVEQAKQRNVRVIDYYKREELTVLNTIPTVEGAIQVAMEQSKITLHNSKILICGYGRIGKLLAMRLKMLGADIFVAARHAVDFAWIRAYGYQGISYLQLEDQNLPFDFLFNTVPFMVVSSPILDHLKNTCCIIDLASKPGGVDFEYAEKTGKKAISAISLPSKVAPETAGEFIGETLINILNETI